MVLPRYAWFEFRNRAAEATTKSWVLPGKEKIEKNETEMSLKIKEEVKKQFDADFLAVARYPKWVANIVLVPKKDGKVRMCVDYRDLNRASPKDNFPLSHIDVLVDNTTNFPYSLSWMGFRVTIR